MRARANIKTHPVHPMLVVFPIGLWVTGWIMDLIGSALTNPSLFSAGWYMQLAGCAGAVLAAVFGAIDLFTVVPPGSSGRMHGYQHAGLNLIALGLFCLVLAVRGGSPADPPTWLSLVLGACGIVVVAISGWLGGTLVYRNQIGVERHYPGARQWLQRNLADWDHPVCGEHELGYGQMMLAHIGGERIVIARCNDGVVAFSDRCTHRGGPLSDGSLAGCIVQCPWHGSQFDAHTGRVIAGPAGAQIKTYQVEIRAGEVYVLPPTTVPKAA